MVAIVRVVAVFFMVPSLVGGVVEPAEPGGCRGQPSRLDRYVAGKQGLPYIATQRRERIARSTVTGSPSGAVPAASCSYSRDPSGYRATRPSASECTPQP